MFSAADSEPPFPTKRLDATIQDGRVKPTVVLTFAKKITDQKKQGMVGTGITSSSIGAALSSGFMTASAAASSAQEGLFMNATSFISDMWGQASAPSVGSQQQGSSGQRE